MASPETLSRLADLESVSRDVQRWSARVDRLIEAFYRSPDPPPRLADKLEALRNKRDTLLTKLAAVELHGTGSARALREYEAAKRETRDAWQLVIGELGREALLP